MLEFATLHIWDFAHIGYCIYSMLHILDIAIIDSCNITYITFSIYCKYDILHILEFASSSHQWKFNIRKTVSAYRCARLYFYLTYVILQFFLFSQCLEIILKEYPVSPKFSF